MKTLVIQLARLGDILQTLPALNAYCRQMSDEEVHFLVRKKFSEIAHLLPVSSKVLEMDTATVLTPIVTEGANATSVVITEFEAWVQKLRAEGYTKIINLSFSPFSSYLTKLLSVNGVSVLGYTRHEDGFLAIPDDASAYFYGQVGVNKSNRFHLIDLFASIMGVDLTEKDWQIQLPQKTFFASKPYLAFHVGASNPKKALPVDILGRLLVQMSKILNFDIYLLGSKEDAESAEQLTNQVTAVNIKNLVGKTSLSELIDIISGAELFLGADSGPMQICNLTNTKTVNFSNQYVNFWETGPRSKESYVCYAKEFKLLNVTEVATEIQNILANQSSHWIKGDRIGYYGAYPSSSTQDFQWNLIRAIYLGENFPILDSSQFARAIVHLNEVNEISLHHLTHFQVGNRQQSQVLETADQIMDSLATEVEELAPLVHWFRTEKIRLGPMPLMDLILKYVALHKKLKEVLALYLRPKWEIGEEIL